jgi:hypothetical protein
MPLVRPEGRALRAFILYKVWVHIVGVGSYDSAIFRQSGPTDGLCWPLFCTKCGPKRTDLFELVSRHLCGGFTAPHCRCVTRRCCSATSRHWHRKQQSGRRHCKHALTGEWIWLWTCAQPTRACPCVTCVANSAALPGHGIPSADVVRA